MIFSRLQRPLWGVILASALVLATSPGTWAAEGKRPEARAYNYDETGQLGHLELTMSAAVPFTFFSLSAPDRIVLDLADFSWGALRGQTIESEMVAAVRLGEAENERARLVLDLKLPVMITSAEVTESDQGAAIRIELARDSEAAFVARAGWPDRPKWQGLALASPRPPAEVGDVVIAIDPGHGGIDPGAERDGMVEKAVVLRFARRLAQAIEARPGMSAFLTRERDKFLRLEDRVRQARLGGAHALLSIHADLLEDGGASGMSVYTLSDLGSEEAEESLTVEESRDEIIGSIDLGGAGDDLTKVLIDLAQRGTMSEGDKLADALLGALRGEFKLLRTRPHRRAGYRVLKSPDLPSVLVELGFLSSEADRKRLRSRAWQLKAAEALASGLAAWVEVANPGFLSPKRWSETAN